MRLGDSGVFGSMRGRRAGRKMGIFLVIILIFVAILTVVIAVGRFFAPIIFQVAENEAKRIAIVTSDRAILEIFNKLDISYDDLFTLEKNDEGKIISLSSDMINVNRVKSEVALCVQERISNIKSTELNLPLGTILGSNLFAGFGPYISFEMMPVGVSVVDIVSEFTDSGINQTHLSISLKVNTDIMLLMPGMRRLSKISCDVPVIDTVILGDVPSSYVNVDREGYEFEDDVLQLAEE